MRNSLIVILLSGAFLLPVKAYPAFDWFWKLCGWDVAVEAAPRFPAFLNGPPTGGTEQALAGARMVLADFDPAKGVTWDNPTPEREKAWTELLAVNDLVAADGWSAPYEKEILENAEVLTEGDIQGFARWLTALAVYQELSGQPSRATLLHAYAVGQSDTELIRSLGEFGALLYLSVADERNPEESVEEHLARIHQRSQETYRIIREAAEQATQQPQEAPSDDPPSAQEAP